MNLSILFKFLNKSKENSNTTLASFKDLYQIPSIKDIKDKYLLNKIKEYQKIYNKILTSKKLLTSFDFKIDNITEDMKMYLDLLSNTLLEEKSSYFKKETEKFSLSDALKLQMYLSNINELYLKNFARLIALNEILNKKKFFLPKNKLNALNEAMYQLIVGMNIFLNQKITIELKIKNFLNKLEQENAKVDQTSKYEHIKHLASYVIPDILKSIIKEDYPISTSLALIERALEMYVYQNKQNLPDLQKEVYSINDLPNNIPLILNKIKRIETLYEIYDRFGHNLIQEEDLKILYTKKFYVITSSPLNIKEPIISPNSPKIEIKTYKKFTEDILKNELKYYWQTDIKFYYIFSKIYKGNKTYYDYEEILKTPLLLAFLTYNGYYVYFLDNYLINTKDYSGLNFFNEIMAWEESVPLITILKIMELNNIQNSFHTISKYAFKKSHQNDYKLPDGLTHINLNADIHNNSGVITNIIKKNVANKKLIFPYPLKSYAGPIFSSITKGCILNEGLEYLYLNEHEEISELVIPSSLKVLTNTDNRPLKINTIIFNNYKNSALLNNKDALTNLLKHIISYEPIETKYHFETDTNGKIDMNKPYYEFLFKIKCRFEKIILADKKGRECTIIYPQDLNFCYSYITKVITSESILYEYYVIIANKIYEIIRNYNKKNKNPKRTKRQL